MIVATQGFSQSEIKAQKDCRSGNSDHRLSRAAAFRAGIETEVVPFDQIIPQVVAGNYEAGLIIHEGQLTYAKAGLQRIVDLGKWWLKVTGLPLPLGGNAIKRSLGPELTAKVSGALRDSIQYALDHRDEALAYAMQFARDVDPQLRDKFVGMYVNERTLDYGPDGREGRAPPAGHGTQSRNHSARSKSGFCLEEPSGF
jgi:1,4-dihydroxy-6-naphthoate synthase